MITAEDIEAGRSDKGGWTRKTLATWGVPWPPPKGWQKRLLAATSFSNTTIKHKITKIDLLRREKERVLNLIQGLCALGFDKPSDVMERLSSINCEIINEERQINNGR